MCALKTCKLHLIVVWYFKFYFRARMLENNYPEKPMAQNTNSL